MLVCARTAINDQIADGTLWLPCVLPFKNAQRYLDILRTAKVFLIEARGIFGGDFDIGEKNSPCYRRDHIGDRNSGQFTTIYLTIQVNLPDDCRVLCVDPWLGGSDLAKGLFPSMRDNNAAEYIIAARERSDGYRSLPLCSSGSSRSSSCSHPIIFRHFGCFPL